MEHGAIAQLGERFAGSEEVRGSIPLGSTIPSQLPFMNIPNAITGSFAFAFAA